ncbi:MAG: EAL domain-containing protein [Trueperaceae bacterium]|nr:EAL domain-containing protein [Trueperaceae bacterium]
MFQSRYLWTWLLTPDGVLVEVNDLALSAIDSARDAVVWRPVWETPWFAGDPTLREQLRQSTGLVSSGEEMRTISDVYGHGGLRCLDLTLRAYRDAEGSPTLLILEGRDLSELRDLKRDHDAIFEALEVGVVVHAPDLSIRHANRAARTLLDAPDAILQCDGSVIDEDGQSLSDREAPPARALDAGRPVLDVVIGLTRGDGTTWLRVDAHPLHHPDRSAPHGVVALYRDVTELRRQRRLIEHNTQLDPLTGLANRASFFAELDRSLAAGEPLTVLGLDLDHFRQVNDLHGHEIGDRLLRWVARQLERAIRPDDMPARLGSDEFALLLRGVQDEDAARQVAERIRNQLDGAPRVGGQRIEVGASMGLAHARSGQAGEDLMREVDYALAHAKRHGRGHWTAFNEELGRQQVRQQGIEAELARATELDQLEVYYQPLVNAKNQQVVGAEALMRWHHPDRGLVPPAEFIPQAERSGQIVEMETWLQRVAMTQLRQWNRAKPELTLSMNLSARQLERPDFVARFATLLEDTGVEPANVIAEVTETFAMHYPREAARVLTGLSELGVSLAIDDFGTGYSNLGQLQHLPFEIVKVDRGFLRDVPENQRNFALVRTIIAMAQSLDLRIIAEGVETKTQADFLYWEGANWLQGFHFGRPMPSATFGQVALGGALLLDDL